MKLFAWSKDFNPNLQNSTTTQVCVKIYRLSQEYWCSKILFDIASSVGTPICIGYASINPMVDRTFGQFVRVLVEMDVTKTPRY
jgi:polysaccharide pyruvyl transferase WcaK-like protein